MSVETKESFLIWIDILGFKDLAKEIAKQSNVSERKVRQDFIRTLSEKISSLKKTNGLLGKNMAIAMIGYLLFLLKMP